LLRRKPAVKPYHASIPAVKKNNLPLAVRILNTGLNLAFPPYEKNLSEVTTVKKQLLLAVLSSALTFSATAQETRQALSQKGVDRIVKEVRHELVMLPFYGVFDNLGYKVDPDGTVTLLGQVSRPVLKSDAENVAKRIEGVEKVINNLEVLPASPNDDRIRRAAYRAIYNNSTLSQYQLRAVPPIHIIVNKGHITLEGVVARQMDKQIAGMQANSVQGAFSVTNNLQVEEAEKKHDKK
jgi:hyperosmotically inducible protein